MAAIKSKGMSPEMYVRRLVHRLGYRYRLHVRDLPGNPDLVFRNRHKVIFVHGCYWHRHTCRKGKSLPKTRHKFWKDKLDGNARRDRRARAKLRRDGWEVLVIWECQLTKSEWVERQLKEFLDG